MVEPLRLVGLSSSVDHITGADHSVDARAQASRVGKQGPQDAQVGRLAQDIQVDGYPDGNLRGGPDVEMVL